MVPIQDFLESVEEEIEANPLRLTQKVNNFGEGFQWEGERENLMMRKHNERFIWLEKHRIKV